ncbi:PAS domain S-box protein [Leptolyngbya sp. Heron Island J]|uniref:PAS domain S-box protein n=1 Tax=Leptolyngbya sp. Heron Island J TaxID=1385935 RepID=UPI00137907C8|nr:PAS domain S-box protein [Leptolyngbya sp. Heron Island J]
MIAQIVGVTAVTGWLAHRNGQEAVETLAYQLLNQTGEHFQHKLETYTSVPRLITQENEDELALQQLDTENLNRWFPHLFRQIQRFPEVTYIYYGDADGRYVELSRLPDDSLEFAIKDDAADELVKISPVTSDGRLQTRAPKNSYDPRQRPWYQIATNNQSPRWTGIYDFEDPSPTLGISFVRPYLGTDNSFQGVLGADFTLDAIETFVRRVQTSPANAMFLMDTDGKILVSSAGQPPFDQPTPSASNEQVEQQVLVETAAEHVLNRLTNQPLQSAQQFSFRIQRENYWVQITPFTDNYGLHWLGVSLLPEADFTGQIRANSRNTVLLSLLAMAISSGVSILIARWINRPIRHLGLATQSLAQGNTSQGLLPSSIQELNLLIDSFNRMADDLKTSRSQLKTYSQQLESLVERRTQALQHSEETFAKVFQASPNAITLSTLDEGRYIKVNDRFVELLGLPREKILGHTSTELGIWIEPKTREVFRQELIHNRLRNQEWSVRNALREVKTVLLSAEIIYFQEEACVLVIANDISDRIAKQEQLRQSEERWQLALKGNNDGIWDWNLASNEIFYSARWKEILGYCDDEIRNHKSEWERRLHPADRERVLRSTQAHLAQQTSFFTEEYRLRCKNGQYKWILDRGQALWDATGTPIRMVGSHTDISDRKRNEATIQQQEQFLRSIYNGVAVGIFVVDVLGHHQFRYVDSNATVERMSGTKRQSLIDSTPEDLFSPETAIEIIHKYQHCVDCGQPRTFEEQLLINHQWNWWLTTLTPLHNSEGDIHRIIGTTVNITARKTIEEELAQQVQSERLLTKISNEIRQSLNTQKTYQTTVEEIGLAFGISRCCLHIYTDASGPKLDTVAEYLIPDYSSRKDFELPILQSSHIQTVLSQENALVTDDVAQTAEFQQELALWEQLHIKSIIAIRTSYQDQPNGVIEIHQCDRQRTWLAWEIELLESVAAQVGIAIAQARLLEQEHAQRKELARQNIALETAIQAAEQASQVKSEFLANMSHELRTPLNAILGFVQIMQRALKYNPAQFQQDSVQHLDVIRTSGDHLLTLINSVLDMAKIEAGRTHLHSHPFNLHNLLQSVTAMFQTKAMEKGVLLTCDYGPEVPQYVQTDEAKLRQILINLLGNAIKFTDDGHITLKVYGHAPLCIEVQDTGQGIAPHELEHLFQAFYQTDAGRQSQSGTGLGLAISQTYVELLGGHLSVQSTLGQGSTFQFNLPITPIEQLKVEENTAHPVVIHLAPAQPSYRILVVEDQWNSRTLLVQLLETVGFEVRSAANGQEAVSLWEEWHPHLIWMDMRMPIMDGYEATQHIRASIKGQAPAIIALTASALESEKQMVLSIGCDDFVRKPFQDSVIFQKLQQHLGVQYIYEHQPPGNTGLLSSDTQHQIIAQLLSLQPQNWLTQLYQASELGDAAWVSHLIQEIPTADHQLATALKKLVKGFRCDLIAELSAASIGSHRT